MKCIQEVARIMRELAPDVAAGTGKWRVSIGLDVDTQCAVVHVVSAEDLGAFYSRGRDPEGEFVPSVSIMGLGEEKCTLVLSNMFVLLEGDVPSNGVEAFPEELQGKIIWCFEEWERLRAESPGVIQEHGAHFGIEC